MIRVTLDLSIEQLAKTLASTLMEMHTGVYAGDKSIVGMLRDALVSTYDAGIAEGRSQRGKLTVDDGAIGVIRAPAGITDWSCRETVTAPSTGDATPLVPRFDDTLTLAELRRASTLDWQPDELQGIGPLYPPEGYSLLDADVRCQCDKLFDAGHGRLYCCGKGAPKIYVATVSLSGEGSGG